MAYFKARVGSGGKTDFPSLLWIGENYSGGGTYSDNYDNSDDLIVVSAVYLPSSVQGVELIDSWRSTSDYSGKTAALYRTTGGTITMTFLNAYCVERFSRNSKKLNYEFLTLGGSTVLTTLPINIGELLVYPQRNTNLSGFNNLKTVLPMTNWRSDVLRANDDSGSTTVKTASGVGLTVVKIY